MHAESTALAAADPTLESYRHYLSKLAGVDELQRERHGWEATRRLAKERGQSIESQNLAGAYSIEASIALGNELIETAITGKRAKSSKSELLPRLADLGISKRESSDCQTLALDATGVREWMSSAPEVTLGRATTWARRTKKDDSRRAKRVANAEKLATIPTLEGVIESQVGFSTIVVDPPWDWGDEDDHEQMGRGRPTYQTMPIEDVAQLELMRIADQYAHLYLWITNRSLPKGFALLEGWGFKYVTCLTWAKPHFGMGNYFRGQTEQILFGVRGELPLLRHDVGTILTAPRGPGGHSSKPDEFYELIETCSPAPRIDIFARRKRAGWFGFGEDGFWRP